MGVLLRSIAYIGWAGATALPGAWSSSAEAASLDPPATAIPTLNRGTADKLSSEFDRLAALGYSGAAVVLRNGDVLLSRGSGLAAPGRPFTPDTVFDIASITKPLTAMAILRLSEQGKIGLDDPLGRWFPEAPADKRGITLRQIASHSAGLPDFIEGQSDYKAVERDVMAQKILGAMLEFQPGARSRYSNAGYVLLGIVIERASGESIHDYMKREIFDRAGVKASYNPRDFSPDIVAMGHTSGRWSDPLKFADPGARGPFWALWGSGGIYMSTADLARLATAFFEGRIVGPALVEQAVTPVASESAVMAEGYGWGLYRTQRGTRVIAHNGRGFHTVANLVHYPEAGLTSAALSNSRAPGAMRVARELAHAVVGPDLPPQPRPEVAGAPGSAADRALVAHFIEAMNAADPEMLKFIVDNVTQRKRAQDTDEEIGLEMWNYARRMGRPELIEVRRDSDRLTALMINHEGQQPSLIRLEMRLVDQGGRTMIDNFDADGVARTDL